MYIDGLLTAKWLLEIKPDIDITAMNDFAFRHCCKLKRMEVVYWLISLIPDRYELLEVNEKNVKYRINKKKSSSKPFLKYIYDRIYK